MSLRAQNSSDSMNKAEWNYANFCIPYMITLCMVTQGRQIQIQKQETKKALTKIMIKIK